MQHWPSGPIRLDIKPGFPRPQRLGFDPRPNTTWLRQEEQLENHLRSLRLVGARSEFLPKILEPSSACPGNGRKMSGVASFPPDTGPARWTAPSGPQ
jgi:hypothetical protein